MKRFLKVGMKTMLVVVALSLLISGALLAAETPAGPAPNAGDGESDGSGLTQPYGPNSEAADDAESIGPAPNAGDGIPDGSGF